MATYDELMVYKQAYDLTVEVMTLTRKMEKAYKFTLGERINEACVDCLLSVYRINSSRGGERERFFTQAREQIELVRLLLRLTRDLHLIAVRRFSVLNEYVESISKQLTAWQRASPNPSQGGA